LSAFIDLTGKQFGRWTVLKRAGNIDTFMEPNALSGSKFILKTNRPAWLCRCICGSLRRVRSAILLNEDSRSCGCLRSEVAVENGKRTVRHGRSHTPEHRAYIGAKRRCSDPNVDLFKYYGGRGIEFRFASFEKFYAELGDKPEPKHLYSIDRFPNNGNYEPGNVRWATSEQQNNNRRAFWFVSTKQEVAWAA
jgi:hypothetical protein